MSFSTSEWPIQGQSNKSSYRLVWRTGSTETEVVQTQRNLKLALVNRERPGITAGLGSFSPGAEEPHPSLRGLVLLRLSLFRQNVRRELEYHSAICSALGEWELELREEHRGERFHGSEAKPPCSTRCPRWVFSWCCYSNISFFLRPLRNPATLIKKSLLFLWT